MYAKTLSRNACGLHSPPHPFTKILALEMPHANTVLNGFGIHSQVSTIQHFGAWTLRVDLLEGLKRLGTVTALGGPSVCPTGAKGIIACVVLFVEHLRGLKMFGNVRYKRDPRELAIAHIRRHSCTLSTNWFSIISIAGYSQTPGGSKGRSSNLLKFRGFFEVPWV